MNCQIYRSQKVDETYLFLAADLSFEELPDDLRATFGVPVFVMELKLTAKSKLARVETHCVLESLRERGYFLQLPPAISTEEEISKQFS